MASLFQHFLWHCRFFDLLLNDLVVSLAALESTIGPLACTAGTSLQYSHKVL